MKFSCERCQTRYSIGDEKVRGKVLKIRCKTCGNIVVVREQMATALVENATAVGAGQLASTGTNSISAADVAEAATDAPPPAPQSGGIEWFIAIKGKQHGPAGADDVARLYREGQISERSYLWHEKLPAWTRLKELPEFAALVAEGPAPARRPPSPPPPPEEGAEIVNLEAARAQRQQRDGASPPAAHDPFAAVAPGPDTQPGLRDSTRVFLQKAGLHNRGTKHKLYAAIASVGALAFITLVVVDYQLDILGLRQVVDAVAEKTGIIEAPPDEGPGWDDVDGDPTLKCQLMPDPAACIKKAKAKAAKAGGTKKAATTVAAVGASVGGDDLKDAFGSGSGGGAGDRPVGVSVGQDGFMNVGAGTPSQDALGRMMKGKGGPSGPKARVELPATIGAGIDAENAKKVVQDGQGAIQVCVDSAMKTGEDIPNKVVFTLSIGQKGNVEKAAAGSAVVGASTLGSCLSGAMRKWKFAPPTEPTDLDIPLILR